MNEWTKIHTRKYNPLFSITMNEFPNEILSKQNCSVNTLEYWMLYGRLIRHKSTFFIYIYWMIISSQPNRCMFTHLGCWWLFPFFSLNEKRKKPGQWVSSTTENRSCFFCKVLKISCIFMYSNVANCGDISERKWLQLFKFLGYNDISH